MVGADLDPIVQGLGVAELLVDRGDGVPSGYQDDGMCVGELRLLGSSLLRQSRKIITLFGRYTGIKCSMQVLSLDNWKLDQKQNSCISSL